METATSETSRDTFQRRERMVMICGSIGAIALVVSVWSLGASVDGELTEIPVWKRLLVAGWVLFPPIWFWYEYSFIFDERDRRDESLMRRRKDAQDVASKVWLSAAAVMAALAFGGQMLP
jgi:hypothetical protein